MLTKDDESHLQMLATGFRIVGGLTALCVNIAWLHVIVGFATMMGVMGTTASSKGDAVGGIVGTAFGGTFAFVGLMVIGLGYVLGIFGFKAAKCLERRQNYSLCLWTAIAMMLVQPLGLILGILALFVLNRQTVKDAFSS